ncbi:hypothetical protein DMH18_36255 [Streptomyces sp. WAC 06783]|uniref:hypothetical protein n=1 Tax=Streptomyces sp. WAC 06783 TaxID=2203211 RepID=UPI000F73CF7C|nr:hypothetical protein [Streptomyces sp. WAC 06783]RSO03837.1 hypothetical protein DMH18_36255 [Streptomyces sp. WAC 06783]
MAPATTHGLSWADHFGLDGSWVNNPGIGPNADDRLQTFVQGSDQSLHTKWQEAGGNWSQNWYRYPDTGGNVDGTPVALRSPDGFLHVFWRGPDNSIWNLHQQEINGTWGTSAKIASSAASNPAVALNADGRISVFYTGTDAAIWQVNQQQVDYTTWTQPSTLGGNVGTNAKLAPAVVRNGEGRLEVFAHGHEDEVWGIAQKAADATSSWGPWTQISARKAGVTGSPFAVTDADQRVRVFWRAGSTGYHAAQSAQYTFPATPQPQQLPGTIVEAPVAVLAMDGRLQVFVIGTDRSLSVIEQRPHNDDTFTQPQQLGGQLPGLPVPAKYADNRIVVPYRGADSKWYAFRQV